MTAREDIFAALFALGAGAAWANGGAFVTASRRVRLWNDVAQPAFFQAEHDETARQVTGRPALLTLRAVWMVYHAAGADPNTTPATVSNQILDALSNVLAPPDGSELQTLGGLVHHAFIDGRISKISGDIDGQALLVVPITLLVP